MILIKGGRVIDPEKKKEWKADICVGKTIRWWRSQNLLPNRNGYFRLFYGLGTMGGRWKKGTTKDYFR